MMEPAGGAEARNVYVCLAKGGAFTVASNGKMTLSDAAQKKHSLPRSVALRVSGGKLVAGKSSWKLPAQISSSGLLRHNNRSYRGSFLVSSQGFLLNVLNVEDYLRGVLPAEVGGDWAMEALKAQAIISRTYVLRQSMGRSSKGYDVLDTVTDQVYRGAGVETARTDKAVTETAGQVLVYGKGLAFTPFHSDSGGHTADNAEVWGKDLPYLKGVPEPVVYRSPNSTWTVKIPAAQVQRALAKIGGSVGTVREIRVGGGTGGRASTLTFVGSNGSKTVRSSLFRMAIGPNVLKSTFLTGGGGGAFHKHPPVSVPSKVPEPIIKESEWQPEASASKTEGLPKVPVPTSDTPMTLQQEERLLHLTAEGAFSTAELMDMLMNPDKRKGYLYLAIQRGGGGSGRGKSAKLPSFSKVPSFPPLPQREAAKPVGVILPHNGVFTFHGRGWGHGVGLSQWGMLSLAKQGWGAERVLTHYYPGTSVKRFK